MQSKYKYYCSCCNTSYILNTLQFHHCNCHSFMHTLYHVHAEPESENQEEQVQVEDITNSFPE
jgi:hypothetical protein